VRLGPPEESATFQVSGVVSSLAMSRFHSSACAVSRGFAWLKEFSELFDYFLVELVLPSDLGKTK
jgi:hypothetical protein